ncbi:nucleotide exchange factor GrpE [Anabaena sp. FACHB-1250]|uniref:Nucleotide exchange factor GrpE n=1 Tax=Dolichospermum flos-aquae LEGE 04289 TaxID=1828708 RepID=A0ACC5PW12_DOLFA|nr:MULTISPECIES: nucleotide exchange factor GrpE [Nostocales]MBD2142000.1 nucleotide exchange factor GrpE [Anabaena sp. FACHB-1250]MBD2268577.1 nucleotide exchange factor GrpE [Anabaena sp. FACHB-1391]MBE9217242.1 nucleotide exchange factor GrpE [Dolichospermum flos-aquae LEGE 04289]
MKSEFSSEINPNEPGHEVNEQTPEQFQQFNQPQDILMTEEIDQDRPQPVEINIAALSDLTGQIESLKVQLEERSTQYMRIAADFENYRKRTSKEKEEIDLQVKRNTITELLPVVDNFERARSHLKPQSEGEMTIHKSYQGVYKQLVDCLKRLGVAPMRPEGQLFDPNLHEAVMREATDEHPEGTVLEELVRGYYFGDRVLRHAMVKVAAPKEDVSSSPEDSV